MKLPVVYLLETWKDWMGNQIQFLGHFSKEELYARKPFLPEEITGNRSSKIPEFGIAFIHLLPYHLQKLGV